MTLEEILLNKGMLLIGGGLVFLVLGFIAVFSSGPDNKQVEIKEETKKDKKNSNKQVGVSSHLDLKDASGLWRPKEKGEDDESTEDIIKKIYRKDKDGQRIELEDLTPLWRDEENIKMHDGPTPEFKNDRITAFFKKHIKGNTVFRSSPLQTKICTRILELLDQDGNCPSVVNVKNDYEAANLLKNKTSYDLLEAVSLIGHSLNVAEETISKLSDQKLIIPTAMIAALGHDLGKLETARNELYRTGNHPLVSVSVLHTIEGFDQLPRQEEVSKAVANHHSKSESHIGKILQAADQAARKKELSALNAKQMKARQDELRETMKRTSDDKKEDEIKKEPPRPSAEAKKAAARVVSKPSEPKEDPILPEDVDDEPILPDVEDSTSSAEAGEAEPEDDGLDFLPSDEAEEDDLDGIQPPPDDEVERAEESMVPLMVTDEDISSLKMLGYSDDEIADLTPSEAFEIIENEVKRCERDTDGALTSVGNYYTEDEIEDKSVKEKPSGDNVDISWIDLTELLARIRKEVNILDGPRWQAFSMLNGVVYAQVGLLMDIIRQLAKENNDLSFESIDDDQMKRDVLISVIDRLRDEINAIDNDLLTPGYIGCHFHLKWENGQDSKKPSYYLPLRAETVGDLSEMENSKPKRIRKVVEVIPLKNKEI